MSLSERLAYPLSNADLNFLLPTVPITTYARFAEYPPLTSVVDSAGRGLVLFVSHVKGSTLTGHWLAILLRREHGTVLLFDPYGGKRDPWGLNHGFVRSRRVLSDLGEETPLLVPYFAQLGFKAVFNTTRDQEMALHIGTCGRHCVVRLWHMSMPDEEYDTWVHGFDESPDVVVTQLTDERLEGGLATLYETDSEDFE
jgi:hypothetical protein